MKPRISMITLGVSDLEKSIKFYKEGLGFPRKESPTEIAFFTLNGSWLSLYNRESLAEDATVLPEGSGLNRFTLSHNVASEYSVDLRIEPGIPDLIETILADKGIKYATKWVKKGAENPSP